LKHTEHSNGNDDMANWINKMVYYCTISRERVYFEAYKGHVFN